MSAAGPLPRLRRDKLCRPIARASSNYCPFMCLSLLQCRRKLRNFLSHYFAGLEFNRRAGRDFKAAAWLVRITTHAFFRQTYLEHTEIAQLDVLSLRKIVGNQV